MKRVRKWAVGLLGMIAACCVFIPVQAAGDITVVEKYTSEDGVVLYIKGLAQMEWEAEYQVGASSCPVESIRLLNEAEETIYTLILWDNSLSVMNGNEEAIKSILVDVVANRAPGEKFAIALLGEELTYLTDYSSDYASIKQLVEGTEGEDKDAYYIENLYEAVRSFNEISDIGYKRIIVISDGMDAAQIGYSERELFDLLEKNTYMIYSIGVGGGDAQALQSMFSVSRTTNAEYYYLDEIEDTMDVVKSLGEDYGIVQVKAVIPNELRDGSTQNSQIILTSGTESYTLQSQVTLPFGSILSDEDVQTTQDQEDAETTGEADEDSETAPAWSENVMEKSPINSTLLIGISGGAAVLVIGVVSAVILTGRKKKGKASGNDYQKLDQQIKNERSGSTPGSDRLTQSPQSSTVEKHKSGAGGSKTMLLFDTQNSQSDTAARAGKRILLTAVSDPGKAYQCGITDSIVIGRKPTACSLVIATDSAVSERHCEISIVQNRIFVKDLGSSNGTYVNGKRLESAMEVSSGCVLKIGRLEYYLTIQ